MKAVFRVHIDIVMKLKEDKGTSKIEYYCHQQKGEVKQTKIL